ncbi:Sapep family Mn(2+)-dependent dipeptidase [Lactiplantibacillus songbeiensis]|uniref:Sapep family Mn(2+)-dependent dipeptidase n=1 Tax=Lactiplantibacillus songbeiensis TaxID=2559920 RepID=A0ABW4C1I9_9LACO|nr:Sapep family Mn(2+)-dependent dipeptidase [Lactiplantibacillus songbeiensis]
MSVFNFKTALKQQEPTFLKILAQVIAVPSVQGSAKPDAPFGVEPKRVLTTVLNIAEKMGFETHSVNNCVGWVQYGEAPEYIAVLGHLDVVAAGTGWDTDPFKLTIKDDYMYGRGTLDNKGPIMGALFALKLIKEQSLNLKHSIRLIFGTNEESGSADIPFYNQAEQAPIGGFTPDCKYPVVYAERGMLGFRVTAEITDGSLANIRSITGDFNGSYIPDAAVVNLSDGMTKNYVGKKAPSNAPDLGVNVIKQIAADLKKQAGQTGEFFNWLNVILQDTTGKAFGFEYQDQASGMTQFSLSILTKTATTLAVDVRVRYPVSETRTQLVDAIKVKLPAGLILTITRDFPSMYKDPTLPMIQIMQRTYEQVMQTDGKPVTTTGITYARSLPNIVAFGPSFPGQRGIAHKENEWLKLSDWRKMMEIDYLTMISLANEL